MSCKSKNTVILRKGDKILCEKNHLVATVIADEIRSDTKARVADLFFADNQPTQMPNSQMKQCYCGSKWFDITRWGQRKLLNIKNNEP